MSKCKLYFVILLQYLMIVSNNSIGQNLTDIYFVAGSATKTNNIKAEGFYTFLYKIENYEVKILDTLSSPNEEVIFVKKYPDYNCIVVLKENMKNKEKTIVKLEIKSGINKIEKKIKADFRLSFQESICFINKGNLEPYILINGNLDASGDEIIEKNWGFKLRNLEEVSVDSTAYSTAVLTGISGGCFERYNVLRFKFYKDSSSLVIPVTYNFDKRPKFEISLPDSFKFFNNETHLIQINDKQVFLCEINSIETNFSDRKVFILNKKIKKCGLFLFTGNLTSFTSFGNDYIAGYACSYNNRFTIFDYEKSAGYSARKKIERSYNTGEDINERYKASNTISLGKLFIINTMTGREMSIETGQGDSEVLMITGNEVYYRVLDTLYLREFEEDKLGKQILLMKNSIFIDTHWALE